MGLCASHSEEDHAEHDASWTNSVIRLKGKVIEGKKRTGYLMKEELAELKESLNKKRPICLTSQETKTLTLLFNKTADRMTKTLDKMAFLRLFMRTGEGLFDAAHDEGSKTKKGKYKVKHKKEAHGKVEQVFDLFANCDADGNGKVDLAEFLAGVSFWKQQSDFSPQSKLLLYFQLFDTKGQGKLDKTDFQHLLCHMLTFNPHGEYEKGMVEQISQTLFDSIDKKDAKKGIRKKEFVKWCNSNPDVGITPESTNDVFDLYDTDGDKRISREEFMYLVKQRHMQTQHFDSGPIKARLDKITNKIYHSVDRDDSGYIEFEEFNEWLISDASLGTVQNLCDVMQDMNNDLKKLSKQASGAMETIVNVASKGAAEAEEILQTEKDTEKKRLKEQAKDNRRKEKKEKKKADKEAKLAQETKVIEDAAKKKEEEEALKKKQSYKVAAASNPFAREHSHLNSPRT